VNAVVKKLCAFFIFNFCLGLPTALAQAPADQAAAVFNQVSTDPWFYRHGLMLFLLLLVLLACAVWRRRRRVLQIFSNEAGRVYVAPGALADLVENVALHCGALSRPKVLFRMRRGQIHIDVRLKIGAGQRLPQFSNSLQAQIVSALRESFALENLGGVHIIVTGFKGPPPVGKPPAPAERDDHESH
jgi:hypothetical protein